MDYYEITYETAYKDRRDGRKRNYFHKQRFPFYGKTALFPQPKDSRATARIKAKTRYFKLQRQSDIIMVKLFLYTKREITVGVETQDIQDSQQPPLELPPALDHRDGRF